jgi:hypothetical protein
MLLMVVDASFGVRRAVLPCETHSGPAAFPSAGPHFNLARLSALHCIHHSLLSAAARVPPPLVRGWFNPTFVCLAQ